MRSLPAMACVLSCLMATVPSSAEPSIVGAWFGKGQPYDKDQRWLERYAPDGRFSILSRECVKGVAKDHIEEGTWTYKNSVQEVVTTSSNGVPRHYVEQYISVVNDGRTRRYRLSQSNRGALYLGYVYSATHVADDFDLPGCGPTVSLYFAPTNATRSMLVAPGVPSGTPAVMTTLSPGLAKPS